MMRARKDEDQFQAKTPDQNGKLPNDRPATDPHCPHLADRAITHSASLLPLCAKLLAICDCSFAQIWCAKGWLAGDQTANAVPSLGWIGLRSGSLIFTTGRSEALTSDLTSLIR